jgi:hypothetical protein
MSENGWGRPLRDRDELARVLTTALDLWGPAPERYRLVGTGAALAQGVAITTGDIDILVADRGQVDRFAEAMAGFPCLEAPAWLPDARQYFTHFEVDGIDIGASTVEVPTEAETIECFGAGPWKHYVEVQLGPHRVPMSTLELRMVSELVRGRPDRATSLVHHMRQHGFDRALVEQSMTDRHVSPEQQREVLTRLASR